MWRLGGLGGATGGRRGGQDGRGVPRRQLEGQQEPLQSFRLDGDGSVTVAWFLPAERGLLQRLHHQRLSVDRRFDGRRADRITMRLGRGAGRQDQSVSCRGSCGSRGESPGPVKQELRERDGGGGGRGGSTRGGGWVGFEVGRLGVRGDFDVGRLRLRLRLAGLRGGLRVGLVGGLDQGVGSWKRRE